MSKLLTKAIQNNKYDVKNSMELKEKLDTIKTKPDSIIASLDVISMFTNIPMELVEKTIKTQYEGNTIKTRMPYAMMIKILKFTCQFNTEFEFNGQLYKQIKGLRMGSPVSPILASIVMNNIIDTTFKTVQKPILFTKYVDDILIIDNKEKIMNIYKRLNEIDYNVQLELEWMNEKTNSINYLELTIINKRDCSISTKWYQREISSQRILNYHTQHNPTQIRATANNYIRTMIKLTDNIHKKETIKKAKQILRINNYPQKLTENLIKKVMEEQELSSQVTEKINESMYSKQTHMAKNALPYIKGLSTEFAKDIRKGNDNLMIPHTTVNTIKQRIMDKHKKLKGERDEEIG